MQHVVIVTTVHPTSGIPSTSAHGPFDDVAEAEKLRDKSNTEQGAYNAQVVPLRAKTVRAIQKEHDDFKAHNISVLPDPVEPDPTEAATE